MHKDMAMRREEGAFNAIQELSSCRAWLRCLKGEIDASLQRFDAVIKVMESSGPGQGSNVSGRPFEFIRMNPKGNLN